MSFARILIVAVLLLLPAFAFAEQLDERCIPEITFAYTIVVARQQGATKESTFQSFERAREMGIFGDLSNSAAEMLKRIILIMFSGSVDTDEQIKILLIEAQKECVLTQYTIQA